MKYVTDALGIEVKAEPGEYSAGLPYYLTDNYTFRVNRIGKVRCLFVSPKNELPAISAVKKHFAKIAELTENIIPVLLPEALNPRQRAALITAKIPFILEGVQLYLPFLGVLLQERYPVTPKQAGILMPTSQLLLFYFLYHNDDKVYINGLASTLEISAMQITRAVKQLAGLSLFTTYKDGVQIVVKTADNKANLFDKAKPYLINPIKRRLFIDKDTLPPELPYAGYSALSEYTMLNPPNVPAYAYNGSIKDFHGTNMLVDAQTQVELEFWKYSPIILSKNKRSADPLSLWVTLTDDDPRTEIAKEDLLAGVWR